VTVERSWESLTGPLLQECFSYLPLKDLGAAGQVCHHWRANQIAVLQRCDINLFQYFGKRWEGIEGVMQRFSNTSAVVLNLRKTPTSVKKFTEEDVKNLARHYGDKLLVLDVRGHYATFMNLALPVVKTHCPNLQKLQMHCPNLEKKLHEWSYLKVASPVCGSMPIPPLNYKKRPKALQEQVERIFKEQIAPATEEKIPYVVSKTLEEYARSLRTLICGIDEKALLQKMIKNSPHKTEFTILNIGDADFKWNEEMIEAIQEQGALYRRVTITGIGVRFTPLSEETVKKIHHHVIYRLGSFNIEEMAEEFPKRGLELAGKVDLIVSRRYFCKLADPVGTFMQAYDLLCPHTGMMLFDGFIIKYAEDALGVDGLCNGRKNMEQLMLATKAPFLRVWNSADQFVIKRPDENPSQFAMQYHSIEIGLKVPILGRHNEQCVVKFTKETKTEEALPSVTETIVGDANLYEWLKQEGLLSID